MSRLLTILTIIVALHSMAHAQDRRSALPIAVSPRMEQRGIISAPSSFTYSVSHLPSYALLEVTGTLPRDVTVLLERSRPQDEGALEHGFR